MRALDPHSTLPSEPGAAIEEIVRRREESGFSLLRASLTWARRRRRPRRSYTSAGLSPSWYGWWLSHTAPTQGESTRARPRRRGRRRRTRRADSFRPGTAGAGQAYLFRGSPRCRGRPGPRQGGLGLLLGLEFSSASVEPIGLLRNLVNALTDATDRGDAHPGSGPASRADRSDPSRRREPYQDLLDPRGPMGMPKIVSRAANSLGRGPRGGANVLTGIYLLSVLAIIIGLGIFFIV